MYEPPRGRRTWASWRFRKRPDDLGAATPPAFWAQARGLVELRFRHRADHPGDGADSDLVRGNRPGAFLGGCLLSGRTAGRAVARAVA